MGDAKGEEMSAAEGLAESLEHCMADRDAAEAEVQLLRVELNEAQRLLGSGSQRIIKLEEENARLKEAAQGKKLGKEHRDRPHVTDGTPCWCNPIVEDYSNG